MCIYRSTTRTEANNKIINKKEQILQLYLVQPLLCYSLNISSIAKHTIIEKNVISFYPRKSSNNKSITKYTVMVKLVICAKILNSIKYLKNKQASP